MNSTAEEAAWLMPEMLLGLKALAIFAAGWLLAGAAVRILAPRITGHVNLQNKQLITRFVYWLIVGLFAVSALNQLGFELSVLLGAAGILTVALGFASQTSAANIISGLFVIGERSIAVGDVIQVDGRTGEVLSIDWLSIKLRTFDNLYVRIPNELIIRSIVTNLSRHPIRRYDLQVGVAYKEDIGVVRSVLQRVAEGNPLCLEHPAPLIILQGFGDSSVDIQFSVWATRDNYLALRNSMLEEVKRALDLAGIEIPFPHLSVYAGSATTPIPVRMVATDLAD